MDGFQNLFIKGCEDHIIALVEKEMHKVFTRQAKIYGINKLVKSTGKQDTWAPHALVMRILSEYLFFIYFIISTLIMEATTIAHFAVDLVLLARIFSLCTIAQAASRWYF